ncbi:MAG: glycoside hydrolase family 3 C-terminal domain-containing protein [Candidatus Acidiferrales bacterium]
MTIESGRRAWIFAIIAVATILSCRALAQQKSDDAVPPETANFARIDKLLAQMTLEEKMDLIRGEAEPEATSQGQAGYLRGVPRLHVPSLRMADGPPGLLTRVPAEAETATMGVAATFSVADAQANGVVIGREARSLGIDVVLQPFINIDRDITFDRGYNTFGEDPMLTAAMGAAEIEGAQSQDVMAMAKHYVAYDSNSFNIYVDPQTLREVYVAPFADAVKAGVASIMCSYNKLNGVFACDNADTLKTILKGEIGFQGFVTSDWGAVHNVTFVNNGLDMEMPGLIPRDSPFAGLMHSYFETQPPAGGPPPPPDLGAVAGILGGTIPEEPAPDHNALSTFPRDADPRTMRDVLKDGTVKTATITAAARRVLFEMDRFGYLDGKQKHTITVQDIEKNAEVIRKTSEDAAVLLKNDDVLPLKPGDSIAMIGPGAGQVDAIGTFGERSGGLTNRQVSPVGALNKIAPSAKVTFAVDDDMTGTPIPASALSHNGQPGLARTDAAGKSSTDAQIDFTAANHAALDANGTYTWKGTLTVPSAGDYWIYLQELGARGNFAIDAKPIARTGAMKGTVHGDVQHPSQDNAFPTTDGLDNVRRAVTLTAGSHEISVHASGDSSNLPEQVRLNWVTPEARARNRAAAIDTAKNARIAVVFVWTRGKPVFALPGDQDKLVEEVAAVNPNTIVVLNVSQPIAMPWLPKVKGVLQMWWPGDEGGWATAYVLLGKVDPAGRLPFTWARKLTDYPATDPKYPERSSAGVDGKTTFSEGVNIGYRWFDAQNIAPLYPFGFGLSYTTFKYTDLTATSAADGGLDVSIKIQNTGSVAGDEIPQIYLDAPNPAPRGPQFAPRTLAAFTRVTLGPGETRVVNMHVAARALEYWSVTQNRWVRATPRRVNLGTSERDLKLSVNAQ